MITDGDRNWDIRDSRIHPQYEERGRTGDPYLVLTVACGRITAERFDRRKVVFDRIGDLWRATALEPPTAAAPSS